jgi:hypothetical protein
VTKKEGGSPLERSSTMSGQVAPEAAMMRNVETAEEKQYNDKKEAKRLAR